MARKYKRDSKGRFARVAGGAKKRYQKGHKGAGAIHRRRKAQWNSGRKRDKAKVIYKTGIMPYGYIAHAGSYAADRAVQRKKVKSRARSNGFAA